MNTPNKILSEQEIISLLKTNDLLAWISLYDKYAPAMYGLICSVTDDEVWAEEILIKTFSQLKTLGFLSTLNNGLFATLLRYSYSTAVNYLQQIGLSPKTTSVTKETNLIHLFTTQCQSIHQAANLLAITPIEIKTRLNKDFLALKKQHQQVTF